MEIENTSQNNKTEIFNTKQQHLTTKNIEIREAMSQNEHITKINNENPFKELNPESRTLIPKGLTIGNLMALKERADAKNPIHQKNGGNMDMSKGEYKTPQKQKKKRGRPKIESNCKESGEEMKDEIIILRKLSAAKNDNLIDETNDQRDCFTKLNGDLGFTPEFKIVRNEKKKNKFNRPRSKRDNADGYSTPKLKKSKSENNSLSRRRINRRNKSLKRGKGFGHSGYKKQKRGRNGRFVKGMKEESDSSSHEFEEFYTSKEEEERLRGGFRFKRYNELVASLKFLKYINWESLNPQIYKTSPFHSPPLTVMSFWFLICSQYFPRYDTTFYEYMLTKAKKLIEKNNTKLNFMFKKAFKKRNKKSLFVEGLAKCKDEEMRNFVKNIDMDKIEEIAEELAQEIDIVENDENMEEESLNINFKKNYRLSNDIMINETTRLLEKEFGDKIDDDKSRIEKILILKKLPLDCLITSLEKKAQDYEIIRKEGMEDLSNIVLEKIKEEKFFDETFEYNHALKDLFPRFKEEKKFLDLLEETQHNSISESKNEIKNQKNNANQVSSIGLRPSGNHADHKKSDDYDCQICSDGDYSDDNLIVFCARCNVSVHQKCYGLKDIPKGNWICDLCKAYGPDGKYLSCPFCTKRGGAMRETYINAFDEYWKNLNLEYHEEMKLQDGELLDNRPVNPYFEDQSEIEDDDNLSINSKNFTEFLYYNFHKMPVTFSEEELKKCPRPRKTWVHLSCCHWIPEIFFKKLNDDDEDDEISDDDNNSDDGSTASGMKEEKEKKSKDLFIKGIEEIDKRRYNLKCEICDKKQGAGVQCAQRKCQLSYHVECARRANIFIEPANPENPCYIIYCEKHAPLMIKRELESKKKGTIQEITKFCRTVEKYYQSYQYKFDPVDPNDKSFFYLKDDKKKAKIYERPTQSDYVHPLYKNLVKDKFMREVQFELNKYPEFGNVIELKKSLAEDKEGKVTREYSFVNYEPPKKRFLFNKVPKNHKVWSKMAKSRNWQVKGVYKKYRRILAGSKEDPLFGLEKKRVKIKKPRFKYKSIPYREVRDGILFVENKEGKTFNSPKRFVELSDELFCECKKPWKGEIMTGILSPLTEIECSGCTSWFHPECLGIFEKDEVKLNQMVITCSKCKVEKNGHQIRLDNIFLGKRVSPQKELAQEEFKIPESSPVKKLKINDIDEKQMMIEDRDSTQDPQTSSINLLQETSGVKKPEVMSLPSNKENLVINFNRVNSQEELSLIAPSSSDIKQTKIKEFFTTKIEEPSNTETKNSAVVSPEKSPTSTSV